MPGHPSLARNRDFQTLWVGQTVAELGSRVSTFAFPLVGFALSGSAVVAALAEAAFLAGTVLTLLPAGVLVDRSDRRRLMVGAAATGGALYTSLAVAGAAGVLTVPHLVVVGLLVGAAVGVSGPAQVSAIRSVVPTGDLPAALAQNEARQHVASLLGGPLGGVLLGVARWLPFAVNAGTAVVACWAVRRLRTDLSAPPADGPRPRLRTELGQGLRFVLVRPLFRTLLVWSALTNLVLNALLFVVVLRMVSDGVSPGAIGLVNAAAGVGGVLGAVLAPALVRRLPTGRLTVAVAWSVVLPLVPLVWWAHPVVAASSLVVVLLLNPAGNAGIGAYRIAVTPADLQGRVQASSSFLSTAVMPLAPLLGGVLLESRGGGTATAVLLVATAGAALVVTLSPQVRRVPRPEQWPDTAECGAVPVTGTR